MHNNKISDGRLSFCKQSMTQLMAKSVIADWSSYVRMGQKTKDSIKGNNDAIIAKINVFLITTS